MGDNRTAIRGVEGTGLQQEIGGCRPGEVRHPIGLKVPGAATGWGGRQSGLLGQASLQGLGAQVFGGLVGGHPGADEGHLVGQIQFYPVLGKILKEFAQIEVGHRMPPLMVVAGYFGKPVGPLPDLTIVAHS